MCPTLLNGFVLWFGLTSVAPADQPKTPAEKYKALVKAYSQAQTNYTDAYRAAKTDEERKQVSEKLGDQTRADYHAGGFLALIEEDPKGPAALDAACWLLDRASSGPQAEKAVAVILPNWVDDPQLQRVCDKVYLLDPAGDRLLRAAVESKDRTVRGVARFKLAEGLKEKADRMADHRPADREPFEREADELLQQVIDQYADVKHFTTLGKEAEQLRFELRYLGIGKTPPDIAGDDLDGEPLKLTDFRGKVTLVVFWAGWCGPCMFDVPHEKELLKRYEGKPFAIVGVNADKDRAAGQAAAERGEVPWRSFADGRYGPIAKRWNINGWPTLYLLDGTGTIRYKGDYLRTHGVRGSYLDVAVDQLMKEVVTKP